MTGRVDVDGSYASYGSYGSSSREDEGKETRGYGFRGSGVSVATDGRRGSVRFDVGRFGSVMVDSSEFVENLS